MIDWLTILIALVIIVTLVGVFGFLAWKINMSDPLSGENNHQTLDAVNDKKKREKNTADQGKKKRKDQKKPKREAKDEEHQQPRNKPQEPTVQTSEETDDEREESEQELLTVPAQTAETSSKARKRNKNTQSGRAEASANDEPNRGAADHQSKVGSKDEHEPVKQQSKVEGKSAQAANKQTAPTPASSTTKKASQPAQKQQQEQPFTVVGSNRQKNGAQQQQNKSQTNVTSATASVATAVQQLPPATVQAEQLPSRQQLPQRETTAQPSSLPTNLLPSKPESSAVPPKVADLIKVLPSSQVVVTELMSGLDAFPLSTAELDIIMQKIANKQSVLKQDWNKLQLGQKVDPQAHIGQVLTESAKAYEDDVKANSLKHVKDLTDELNKEKRRSNDLLKEKNDKDREIQILHAQLDSVQMNSDLSSQVHPQQAKLQTLESQLKRVTDENLHLNQQILASTRGESSTLPMQVLSEQIKKLSVDNANFEKKSHSNELLAKEVQKEKDDLLRYNEQLIQSLQTAEKDLKHTEEKHHKQANDNRTAHLSDVNALKHRIQELESDNEQLRREEIVHVEPSTATDIQTLTVNNEEREEFEREITELRQTVDSHQQKLAHEIEDYKNKLNDSHTQYQSKENELRNEIDRLKQEKNNAQQQTKESHDHELANKTSELNTLRAELNEVKSTSEQLRTKQQQLLIQLLPVDIHQQLPHDNQDYDQWLASYRQLFASNQRVVQEESTTLKQENAQLHTRMSDVENHLKEIEETVQSKEETLLNELKNKDVTLEQVRGENVQLTDELQRVRRDIQRLQSAHESSVTEARVLKLQLDEKFLAAAHSPAIVADESFELVKQPSPSLSPIVIDIRAGQLNDLMRSSKEALANQESLTNELDKHLDDRHRAGSEETSTVSSSMSNQQS